jgi:predicted RNA binding protein YcfA (HicA-like mRNA interferase family)
MTRLPGVKPKNALRALKRAGFYVDHVKGSHHYLLHPDKPGAIVCVPLHNKDLKRGTLISIISQARMTLDEFLSHL